MSASAPDLPEGVGLDDVRDHAVTLQVAAELINTTSMYLDAQGGTEAEAVAEAALDMLAGRIAASPKAAGSVLLALASVIVNCGDQDTVQAWFAEQGEHVKAALSHE